MIRDEIRPFVRAARPWTDDLRLAARDTAKATPDLTTLVRRAEPLLQHRRLQPGRRRGPRRQVGLAAARAPGGLPLLARLDGAERRLAVLDRRRAGPVAPGHDLRRAGRRCSPGIVERRARRASARATRRSPSSCSTRPGAERPEPDRQAAGHRSSAPATSTTCRPRRRRAAAAASRSSATCRPAGGADAMNKNPPSIGRIAAMVGVHAVGGGAAAVPVDGVRRHAAAAAGGLPLQGGLPRGRRCSSRRPTSGWPA